MITEQELNEIMELLTSHAVNEILAVGTGLEKGRVDKRLLFLLVKKKYDGNLFTVL